MLFRSRQGLITEGIRASVCHSEHGGSKATKGYGDGRAVDMYPTGKSSYSQMDVFLKRYGLGRHLGPADPPHVTGLNTKIAERLRQKRLEEQQKEDVIQPTGKPTGFRDIWSERGGEKGLTPDEIVRRTMFDVDPKTGKPIVSGIVAHDSSRIGPDEATRRSYHISFDNGGWYLNTPLDRQSPHAADFNKSMIGLAHQGMEGDKLSPEAIRHGAHAIAYILKTHPNLTLNDIKTQDRKSTRLNSSHVSESRMPSSA